jgi:hypothetical protein
MPCIASWNPRQTSEDITDFFFTLGIWGSDSVRGLCDSLMRRHFGIFRYLGLRFKIANCDFARNIYYRAFVSLVSFFAFSLILLREVDLSSLPDVPELTPRSIRSLQITHSSSFRDRPKPALTYIRAPGTFSLRAAHSEPQLAHSLNVPPLSAWPAHFVGRRHTELAEISM